MYQSGWKRGTSTAPQPDIETTNWDLLLPETVNRKTPVTSHRMKAGFIAWNTGGQERTLSGCYTCNQESGQKKLIWFHEWFTVTLP
ncbi:MAG: hypothetical protein MK103_09325 [Planctomycetes bacterium]|nr:hypothetical protein [Planctomycetota bacterium]